MSVLDGVEVIAERNEDRPFSEKVKLSQAVNLVGLEGTKVSLSFDQSFF